MSQAEQDRRIDYVEFPATDLADVKRFYSEVFGWAFTDYGPDYTSFNDGRLGGGFTTAARVVTGGALIVLYARDLEVVKNKVGRTGDGSSGRRSSFPAAGGFTSAIRAATNWRSGPTDEGTSADAAHDG